MSASIPNRSTVSAEAPLRLAIAAALAFPDGSMKASGLRRERDAGRLETWITAGKEYTSLAAVEEMTRRCRENQKARAVPTQGAPALSEQQEAEIALAAALARCTRQGRKK